jgi:enoyl-CoA hydratase/carnithine racemase
MEILPNLEIRVSNQSHALLQSKCFFERRNRSLHSFFSSKVARNYHKWTKWDITKKSLKFEPNNTETRDCILVQMNTNKLNTIDYEFISDLNGAIDVLTKDETDFPAYLPVVFTSSGSTFSAGVDMKLVMSLPETELRNNFFTPLNNCIERLYLLPRPTCAAINGHAIGPGLTLAFACDFRVVLDQDDIELSFKEVQYGLPLCAVPFQIAKQQIPSPDPLYELLFTGRNITPHEAYTRLLMNESVEELSELATTACEYMIQAHFEHTHVPFTLQKHLLKEPGIVEMRESGEGKKLDDFFIRQILDEKVRALVTKALLKHKN